MKEENKEDINDLVEIADALGDMMYILCGTIIETWITNMKLFLTKTAK
jgi:hypothetical protein